MKTLVLDEGGLGDVNNVNNDIAAHTTYANNTYTTTSEHPNFREPTVMAGNSTSARLFNHSACGTTKNLSTLNPRTGVPNIFDNPVLEFNTDRDLGVRSLEYNPAMDCFAQSSDRPRGPKAG